MSAPKKDGVVQEAEDAERREVTAYLEAHALSRILNEAVNEVVVVRPADPLNQLSSILRFRSPSVNEIQSVFARQILNTQALPALEVEVVTALGSFKAVTSIGPYDGDEALYEGCGVSKAVEAVRTVLAEKLVGLDPRAQAAIDTALGAEHAAANAVLAASMACCRAGAKHNDCTLAAHIAKLAGYEGQDTKVPAVMTSILNGGPTAQGTSAFFPAELLLVPKQQAHMGGSSSASTPISTAESVRATAAVVRRLPSVLRGEAGLKHVNVGTRGGLAVGGCAGAGTEAFEDAVKCVVEAMKQTGAANSMELALDVHAGDLYEKVSNDVTGELQTQYRLSKFDASIAEKDGSEVAAAPPAPSGKGGKGGAAKEAAAAAAAAAAASAPVIKSAVDLKDMYLGWMSNFPISMIIDPLALGDKDVLCRLGEKAVEGLGERRAEYEAEVEKRHAVEGSPQGGGGGGEKGGGGAGGAGGAGGVGGGAGEDALAVLVPPVEKVRIVADEFAESAEDVTRASEQRIAGSLVLTLNKAGTVTKALSLCRFAQDAGWEVIVCGDETQGNNQHAFLGHLAVGARADFIKWGGLAQSSHVALCNLLLEMDRSAL